MGKRGPHSTQADIARLAGLDQATVSRVLNRTPDYRVAEETQRKVFETAQRLGYDLTRVLHARRRAHSRLPVDIPVSLAIRLKKTHAVYDRGKARCQDLSPSGALLSHLDLPKRSLPLDSFTLDMEVTQGPLKGIRMGGEAIRLQSNGRVSLGIAYRSITDQDKAKISAFIHAKQVGLLV